jgi:glycosyltransferase involved in cell wall biosynthesis
MRVYFQTEAIHYKLKAGLSRYVEELINELKIIDSDNLIHAELNYRYTKKDKIYNLICNVFQHEIHFGRQYDLAHITAMHYEPLEAKKYCATIHDLIVYSHPEFFTKTDVFLYKKYISQVLKLDNFICVSKCTADILIKYFSVNHRKIEIIYEGTSDKFYKETDIETLKKFNIEKPYILFCSTIEPRKNLELLIQAYIEGNFNKQYNLVIVGKLGWNYKRLNQIFKSTEGLIYLGFVADHDLRKLFSMSKVYVNPSIIEGFGLPIIEALKCETKVICSDIKIFNEVGENFVQYFDPYSVKDLIQKLNNVLSNVVDTNITPDQNYFNKFSWEQAAKDTLKYYQTII